MRLFQNFIGGELDADLLTAGTSMSSPALAVMAAVGGTDTMTVVVDPDGIAGAPEIMHVTFHATADPTATVLRGQEGTVARDHLSGIEWVAPLTSGDVTAHSAKLWRNAAYTLSGMGVLDPIEFDIEAWDDTGNASGGAYTAPVTGLYHVSGRTSISNVGSGERFYIGITVDGSETLRGDDSLGAGGRSLMVNGDLRLDAGDVVRMGVFQVNGTLRGLEVGLEYLTYMTISKVGA